MIWLVAFPVTVIVSVVVDALVATNVKPAGTFDGIIFPSAIKSSLLEPLKVSPLSVIVSEPVILPSFANDSDREAEEYDNVAGSLKLMAKSFFK